MSLNAGRGTVAPGRKGSSPCGGVNLSLCPAPARTDPISAPQSASLRGQARTQPILLSAMEMFAIDAVLAENTQTHKDLNQFHA